MQLIGRILQITPDHLRALQDRPKLVKALIYREPELETTKLIAASERIREIAMRAENSPSEAKAAELEKARAEILLEIQSAGIKLPDDEPGESGLCLQNRWHVLHYLITGKVGDASPPLGEAILGGTPIGDDLGYGPARYLNPRQVKEIAGALSSMSPQDFAERFDPAVMLEAKIYGSEQEEKFDMLEYCLAQLVCYYSDAAKRGNAMLLYIH